MATNIHDFIAELRAFDGRRVVVQEMRRAIRRPLPQVRDQVRRHALSILPHSGGLGAWAARSSITLSIRYASSRSAGVKVKGSRKSATDKSDLNRLDAGRVRHPSWGRRGPGQWHTQTVAPGWFSTPIAESAEWRRVIDDAVDRAFDQIRRG